MFKQLNAKWAALFVFGIGSLLAMEGSTLVAHPDDPLTSRCSVGGNQVQRVHHCGDFNVGGNLAVNALGNGVPVATFHGVMSGVVRVQVDSNENAGVTLALSGTPQWSIATFGVQARAPSSGIFFQIYSERMEQNALVINGDTLNVGIGTNSPDAKLHVEGNFIATGTKSFVQDDPSDPTKQIVYVSLEGPEAGTYIRGTTPLVHGEAVIELPEHFEKVTSNEGLTVQLTPLGDFLQLYVVEKGTKRIVIREAQGKSGQFDYLVQGVRKGYENHQVVQEKK